MSSAPGSRPSTTAIVGWLIAAAVLVGLAILVVVNGQSIWRSFFPPDAKSVEGQQIRDLYTIVFAIAVVIFFVVEGLIVWTVVRYRRRPGDDTLPPQTHGNMLAEVTWTLVPSVIVAFLFVVSWQTLNTVDSVAANPDTKIRAVAGQFQWTFDYLANDGQTVLYTQLIPQGKEGGLSVPAGRLVQLSLVSNDVIHAFYVPQFLFKRDVVPGRVNRFDFKVNESDAG